MQDGKDKQRRQNDCSQKARREGSWRKGFDQETSGRSQHHENLVSNTVDRYRVVREHTTRQRSQRQ